MIATSVSLAVLMGAYGAGTVQDYQKDRVALDQQRFPQVSYIRSNLPTDAAIIGSPIYYSYLAEYGTFVEADGPTAHRASVIAGEDVSDYWQNIVLETWPQAHINPIPRDLDLYNSYMAARQSSEVLPGLLIVGDNPLVTDADYVEAYEWSTPQLVAHGQFPNSVRAGEDLLLHSLWVTWGPPAEDYWVKLSLVSTTDTPFVEVVRPLESGWAESPTSGWTSNEFHDADFMLDLPPDLPTGSYTLLLSLLSSDAVPIGDSCISL